eukprot:TRINITY_DN14939_c0_g1_i1.p1 TRINITY_DN14939_c0_g1~~TRINITY_DN14939_c0_g1_i1.p1  ORF type:complete len:307 (-),score=73.00 TRINITY_DN14939_c0_g1_i1:142-1062(-)
MHMHILLPILLLLAATCSSANAQAYRYSVEYQFEDNIHGERQQVFDTYMDAFTMVAGSPLTDVEQGTATRVSHAADMGPCGDVDHLHLRVRAYLTGALEYHKAGTATVDLKYEGEGLTRTEAEDLPIAASGEYAYFAEFQVERDVHVDYSDYAGDTRVFLPTTNDIPPLNTCADVAAVFPGAVEASDNPVDVSLDFAGPVSHLTQLAATYNGMPIHFELETTFNNAEDAATEVDGVVGEFTFTLANGPEPIPDGIMNEFDEIFDDMRRRLAKDTLYSAASTTYACTLQGMCFAALALTWGMVVARQ